MTDSAGTAISAAAILAELRTRQLGRALRVLSETTSTIDVAKQWLAEHGPDGAVVVAERQTLGRGRRGRSWTSPSGGLWLTILRRPNIDPEGVGRLGLALALSAAEAVQAEAGCEVGLKWPNDLVLGGKKLGGVLVETEMAGDLVCAALLSLGLNVNIPDAELPLELRDSATSVLAATGREVALPRLAARFLESAEVGLQAASNDPDAVIEAWSGRDILRGRKVILEVAGNTLRGRTRGIDRQGRLLLSTSWFRRRVISAGEVLSVSEVRP
jgi:BirA family biotin operon repressor/biotin-[acetyl-CoA-carboxylase] ligase